MLNLETLSYYVELTLEKEVSKTGGKI
ncbi:hypothetical protein VCRA2117O376_60140 [Vibrio crassostreae]|nr:hypothetical protein VCRA2117O378_150055 [Vibrio crassostreae]CAK2177690.1 hypothetical protein VCRA2117O376_60140 [Vibrio crassostreae]CAK2182336.1 hypothetical protein VCRA2114O367_60139 [Vibrio crassostreae]CAK2218893.1 hypothetical protein VCRA2117O379_80113 [Vibrio crassostreae]CAK2248882.1 hypothetical protein VCRA2113O356_70116 [Vibrio crassostreae]